jgi:penicillin-binding protein 2
LLRKLAILAVAISWLLGSEIAAARTAETATQEAASSTSGSRTSEATASKRTVKKKRTTRKVRYRHRRSRRRRWGPWHVSSYGDPAADDDPAGDDPAIRQAALEALGKWNGSVVVVDPNSGRVLTIVNQKLALSGGFTPCSTFKPIVALGALREGIITPTTKLRVGRRLRLNVTDALAHSNNAFFSELGEMVGFQRLTHYAREFGLGERAGLDIPGESPGRFPEEPPKKGGVGNLAYLGQDIEVTPLQMAAIISTIANGGTLYKLQYPRTPEESADFHPQVRRLLGDVAPYIPEVREGLAAAVLYGTARSAYDPDLSIFGKTGTCSEDGARLGWFVSYGGDQQPKYVVVVLLRGGRMMFGPHAAEIGGRLYRELLQKESVAQATRQEDSGGDGRR